MENKNMTDENIAEILAKNVVSKKLQAIDTLIGRYLKDIFTSKGEINFINEYNFYDSLMVNPRDYARWCILLAVDFIVDYYKQYMSFVNYKIINQNDGVEMIFEIYNGNHSNDYTGVSILITKNGILTDINNDYVSIVKERRAKDFTGMWNASISENLKERLPLLENSKHTVEKVKVAKI